MIRQLIKMNRDQPFILACSGGPDSMAAADFFKRGSLSFSCAYFDHQTPGAEQAKNLVQSWASDNNVPFLTSSIQGQKPRKESLEQWWRNERYSFLKSFEIPIVMAHHLNDAIETWIFTSLHGESRLIPANSNNIFRPFLLSTKQDLVDWCHTNQVPYVIDASNSDMIHPRNRIRHELMPSALQVNPGIGTMIKKKYLKLLQK
jgi:tRNA(Ile)-lysidine synthase